MQYETCRQVLHDPPKKIRFQIISDLCSLNICSMNISKWVKINERDLRILKRNVNDACATFCNAETCDSSGYCGKQLRVAIVDTTFCITTYFSVQLNINASK